MRIFFNILLAKALIKRAVTVSAAVFTSDATMQFNRNSYVIKVLEAPRGLRETVRVMAQQSPDSVGQNQLVALLTVFEALSPEKQEAFIIAYKGCATLAGEGSQDVVRDHSWDDGHIPPRQEP